MEKGDLVYSKRMEEVLYVEQATKDGTYLLRIVNKRFKEGKPTVAFSYSGITDDFKKLKVKKNRGDNYWFGYLSRNKETRRMILFGCHLYNLLIENTGGGFVEFTDITLSEVTYNLDYLIDDLGYEITIDQDLIDLLWEDELNIKKRR